MKSAYILELTPRTSRVDWGEVHVAVQPENLRAVLEDFGRGHAGCAPFYAIISGATLAVWVVQRGRLTDFVDLHPFIRADLGNGARTLAELWSNERVLREWGSAAMDDVDPWLERLTLEVFWDPIAERLPPLQDPVLGDGESVPFEYGALTPRVLASRVSRSNPMHLSALFKRHPRG